MSFNAAYNADYRDVEMRMTPLYQEEFYTEQDGLLVMGRDADPKKQCCYFLRMVYPGEVWNPYLDQNYSLEGPNRLQSSPHWEDARNRYSYSFVVSYNLHQEALMWYDKARLLETTEKRLTLESRRTNKSYDLPCLVNFEPIWHWLVIQPEERDGPETNRYRTLRFTPFWKEYLAWQRREASGLARCDPLGHARATFLLPSGESGVGPRRDHGIQSDPRRRHQGLR